MKKAPFPCILGILAGVACVFPPFTRQALAVPCDPPIGVAVSVQGDVRVKHGGAGDWIPVRRKDAFCPGDVIRVMERSRADLFLMNETTLRLDQATEIAFSAPTKEKESWLDVLLGGAYFMSRTPRRFKVGTPFVNAGIEGTEYFVRVEKDKALMTVFEGKVTAANELGSVSLGRGQSMEARPGQAPVLRFVARPRDAVQWTLFYPAVVEPRQDAAQDWRQRAAALLAVGRADEAQAVIDEALNTSPGNADALALQAVIAVARNEKGTAFELANKAVAANPESAAARVALSYAQQADFDLEGALSSVQAAVRSEPANALARARLAELFLSFGRLDEALDEAKKASAQHPGIARTQTVLGFAYLAQVQLRDSRDAFERAIGLDQADPLPRLGMGLAAIREGDVRAGREEIEIAASLDPNSSLIRSYLGKAYYEEKRGKTASAQFTMAKELDPADPTPHFYDAILKQSLNRPVEALHDLQKAVSLNDNRAVYRSRLLLDEDLAARSASLGRIYDDLGFRQLALAEGWKSVNTDPANHSAHRFLADSYSALPRHEIARVSELLQSQLLQPININPVQPSLAQKNLFILEGAGPSSPSFNEFSPLFHRDRLALQASGVVGENGIRGEEIAHSGVAGNLSYNLGQFHYQSDGFRVNNDIDQDIYGVFTQYSLSHKTSLQAEFRATDTEKGDLTLNFDPNSFLPDLRVQDKTRSVRAGFRHVLSPASDLIGSIAYEKKEIVDKGSSSFVAFHNTTESRGVSGELQHLFRTNRMNVVSGGGHFRADQDFGTVTIFSLPPPIPSPPPQFGSREADVRHTILYMYSQIRYPETVMWTIGASGDIYRNDFLGDRNQFNPKLGFSWNPLPATTLRAAVFRTLKRALVNDQTLEPTQVAGFNQFFDDAESSRSWRYGGAIDQQISENVHGGAEYSLRKLDVPFVTTFFPPPPAPSIVVIDQVDWKERLGRAYLYWTPHAWLALSAEYLYERFDRSEEFSAGIEDVRTHRVPLGLAFFHPSGFFLRVKETRFDQKGKFQSQFSPIAEPGSDRFWVTDASIGYRLPKRYGIVSVEAKNLFDRSFRFQDTDPVSPVLQPDRNVVFRFTLAL
jgi:tetratricopeptide (TPR) repeat protein